MTSAGQAIGAMVASEVLEASGLTGTTEAQDGNATQAGLAERSRQAVWHPCTQMAALAANPVVPIVAADGPWLIGEGGMRWFDGISSWWTCLLGHRHPDVVAALHQQLDTLDHVMLAGLTHEPAVLLAEALVARTGGALPHVSFASDGSSALEIALKQSAHAWQRRGLPDKHRFVCLADSYHGETLGALGVTDQGVFSRQYHSLLRGALVVEGPDNMRAAAAGWDSEEEAVRAAARLEELLTAQAAQVAAIVLEPLLQGAGGMRLYHPRFLREVRQICDRHQVHWIADEIATGCGRTGTFFAVEQAGVWPDLICLSKGLSGGMLPLSVTLSSADLFAAFLGEQLTDGFLHSHSFSGNPLACRAAVATLQVLQREDVLARNPQRASWIRQGMADLPDHPGISGWRQLGMVWAFEMRGGVAAARAVQVEARQRGLWIRPLGATVYLMPPFLLDEPTCRWLGATLRQAVEAVGHGSVGGGGLADVRTPPVAATPDEVRIA